VERRVSFFIYYWTSLNNITAGGEEDIYVCPTFLGRELYILTLSPDLLLSLLSREPFYVTQRFFFFFLCCVMTGFFVTFIITRNIRFAFFVCNAARPVVFSFSF
jgi:hypothetical protein